MSLVGCVDILSDTSIRGWAADDADRCRPVQVDVVVNALVVATVPCEVFRQDLLMAGIGDGRRGFCFDPGPYLKPGRNHLEVRYTGSDVVVPRGRGDWVRRREGKISEWEAEVLAALDAHCEFRPDLHVCCIGEAAAEQARTFLEAKVPFWKFTGLQLPYDPCAFRMTEEADLVIYWEWSNPEAAGALKSFVDDHIKRPGTLAIGFTESPAACEQIRQVFRECGAPEVQFESIEPAHDGAHRVFAFAETGVPPAASRPATPVIAHIHVPKCAGTSFRVLLEKYFRARHLSLYVNDTYFAYSGTTLRNYLLHDPEIREFSSHHVRVFPHWLAGREVLYVTFLRDPIQQFISYMTHVKKHYAGITSQSLLEAVPPHADQLTLREFAQWLLTQQRDIPFRENHNTNFFSWHSAPSAADQLEAAKTALKGFFFVGITERMEESMAKLVGQARATGLDFPPGPVPVENTSAEYRDDLGWINPDDEVGALLFRSVEKDRQLYDWAAARLGRMAG